MKQKIREKETAIQLRKDGMSYNEILQRVSVSKSSLSLWLRDIDVDTKARSLLDSKIHQSQIFGGESRRQKRIADTEKIHKEARVEIGQLTKRDIFLIGVVLYWAEGTKEKPGRSGVGIDFANSDPFIIQLFIKWLLLFTKIPKNHIQLRLHLHENHKDKEDSMIRYWSRVTGFSKKHFTKTNFKKHKPRTVRKNTGETYKGLIAVRVRKSTNLNRRIQGLIYGIIAAQKS